MGGGYIIMAHKGIRHLGMAESGALAYDQIGFDLAAKDHTNIGVYNHTIWHAGPGTNVDNKVYLDIPSNKTPYWIGIHNCGTVNLETVSVQARSLKGDNLSKNGLYAPETLVNYMEIVPGDIVYGLFDSVAMLRTSSGFPVAYIDIIRLIRGV
jgi:hypothetical protein